MSDELTNETNDAPRLRMFMVRGHGEVTDTDLRLLVGCAEGLGLVVDEATSKSAELDTIEIRANITVVNHHRESSLAKTLQKLGVRTLADLGGIEFRRFWKELREIGETLAWQPELFELMRQHGASFRDLDAQALIPDLETLGLTPRAYSQLKREGVRSVGALTALNKSDVLEIRNVGPGLLEEIQAALLAKRGKQLRDE